MTWDAFTWKVEVFRSKIHILPIVVVVLAVSYVVLPIVAPMLFGPRGDLFGLTLEWFVIGGLGSAICFGAGWGLLQLKQWWRFLLWPLVLFFAGISIYGAVQTVLTGIDLLLPFQSRDVVLARSYYIEPEGGRGAMPESGGWHLVTDSGHEFRMRPNAGARRLQPGTYHLQLSHFRHLVMTKEMTSS